MKGALWNRVIPGLRTPKHKVLGCDIAGRVQAIGRNCNVSKRVEHKWKTLHTICSRSPPFETSNMSPA
jgi:hypothetical protein